MSQPQTHTGTFVNVSYMYLPVLKVLFTETVSAAAGCPAGKPCSTKLRQKYLLTALEAERCG